MYVIKIFKHKSKIPFSMKADAQHNRLTKIYIKDKEHLLTTPM